MSAVAKSNLLIIVASFLFLLMSALLLLFILNPGYRDQRFNKIIEEYKSQNVIEDSSFRNLKRASFYCRTYEQWCELLDLSFNLSETTENWEFLQSIASKAKRKFPGHELFQALYVSSTMWNGQIDKAKDQLKNLRDPRFDGIEAELLLIQESLRIDPEVKPFEGVLNSLKNYQDPAYYEKIARITGNDPLLADAAILWMFAGNLTHSYELIRNMSDPTVADQIPGYISYDYGDLPRAQSYLTNQLMVDRSNHNERWTINELLGDIAYMLHQDSLAEEYYLRSIDIHGSGYWKSYLNLSLLYQRQKILKLSQLYMEKALQLYPEQPEVIEHFVINWKDTYPVVSQRLISIYMSEHPEDITMALSQILNFPAQMTPQEYSAFLWELFNKDSSNKDVAKFLVWYLTSAGDFSGAQLVLERYGRLNQDVHWSYVYSAVIMALESQENLDEAIELLNHSLEYRRDWFVLYNLAVLEAKYGRFNEAMAHIQEAEALWDSKSFEQKPEIESKILSLYSRIYQYMGDEIQALEYARRSLELDEYNNQARSVIMDLNER
jgi:tetratricopeptide (TPR) repeat protein